MSHERRPPSVDHVLSVIGHLGPHAAQKKLRRAQGILYEMRDREFDTNALVGAASVIQGAAIDLMKAAEELKRLARENDPPVAPAQPS
jgi:hypothetical protein